MYRLLSLAALLFTPFAAQAQWTTVQQGFKYDVQGGPGFLARFYLDTDLTVSHDGGVTWTATGLESPAVTFPSVLFSDLHDGEMTAHLDGKTDRWGVYRTRDGHTWTRVRGLLQAEDRSVPRWSGTTLLASDRITGRPGVILRSTDRGVTWDTLRTVPADVNVTPTVLGATARASGGPRTYAATYFNGTPQVYRSDDLNTWTLSPDSLGRITQMAGTTALAVSNPFGLDVRIVGGAVVFTYYSLRRTTDGTTWRRVALPLWRGRNDVGLAQNLVPVDAQTAFASTGDGYLALTRDAGATWSVTDSLGRRHLGDPEGVVTDGRYLYYIDTGASTSDNYLLRRRPLSDYSIATATEATPETSTLSLTASPVPARAAATLRFSLATPGPARLTVYDLLGREVARPFDGLAAGQTATTLDVSALAPGVYVVRLTTGGALITRTLVVAR